MSAAAVPTLALDYKAAAKAVCLSERELARLVAAGEIPHARQGVRVIFPVKELTNWLSERVRDSRVDRRRRSA